MNTPRPKLEHRHVDRLADAMIESLVEQAFEAKLRGEQQTLPGYIKINGERFDVADHLVGRQP